MSQRVFPEGDRWLILGFLPWDTEWESPLCIHVPRGCPIGVFERKSGEKIRTHVEVGGLLYTVGGTPSMVMVSIMEQMSKWVVLDDPDVVKC